MIERGEGAPSRSEEQSGGAMAAAPSIAVDRDAHTDHDTPYTAVHRLVRRFLEPALDVGTLRHVLIQGPSELPALQLFAVTAFILALGLLLRFGDLRAARQLRSSRAGRFRAPPLARSPAREHPRHFGPAAWSAVRSSRAVAAPPGVEAPDRAR